MDFIIKLSSSQGKTTIMSKMAYFMAMNSLLTTIIVASSFFKRVLMLYGMPKSIVLDRDPIFASHFWNELFKLQELEFNFPFSNHP